MERAQVAHQPLRLDLLLDVEPRVGAQRIGRIAGIPDQGQQPLVEGRPQVEARAELRGHERMHRSHDRATGEQIDSAALELARARSGEHETRAAGLLRQLVNDGQQLGNPLHLVDHEIGHAGRRGQLPQTLRPRRVQPLLGRREQVDSDGVRERRLQPGALTGSPRAEQEEMPRRRAEKFPLYRHNECNYGISRGITRLLRGQSRTVVAPAASTTRPDRASTSVRVFRPVCPPRPRRPRR